MVVVIGMGEDYVVGGVEEIELDVGGVGVVDVVEEGFVEEL